MAVALAPPPQTLETSHQTCTQKLPYQIHTHTLPYTACSNGLDANTTGLPGCVYAILTCTIWTSKNLYYLVSNVQCNEARHTA